MVKDSAQRDLASYTLEEKSRIAARARRNVGSECALILTTGFAVTMVVMFFFGNRTFLPIAAVLGLPPILVWCALSFGIAGLCAYAHYVFSHSKVASAKSMQADLLHHYQSIGRAAREEKIRAMQEKK